MSSAPLLQGSFNDGSFFNEDCDGLMRIAQQDIEELAIYTLHQVPELRGFLHIRFDAERRIVLGNLCNALVPFLDPGVQEAACTIAAVCASKHVSNLLAKVISALKIALTVFEPSLGSIFEHEINVAQLLCRVRLVKFGDTLRLVKPVVDVFERGAIKTSRKARLLKLQMRPTYLRHGRRL